MSKKSQVFKAATEFAFESLEMTGHQLATAEVLAFETKKLDARDYDFWKGQVQDIRRRALDFEGQKAASEEVTAEKV